MPRSSRTRAVTGSSVSSSGTRAAGKSNLAVRVLTAAILIPLALGLNYVGGWPFAAGVGAAAVLGFTELAALARSASYNPPYLLGLLAVASLSVSAPLVPHPQTLWIAVVTALVTATGAWLLLPAENRSSFLRWCITVAGSIYVGVLLAHLGVLRQSPRGAWWVAVAFAVTWAYDSGAYFAGSTFGRTPFMAHVSPKKTLEGVCGGLVCSAAAGLIAVPAVNLLWWQALALGVAGGIAAQTGDLFESMLKRQTGVKDSGTLIPGHGGLLDRIDGLLFVAPLVYYVALLTGHAA